MNESIEYKGYIRGEDFYIARNPCVKLSINRKRDQSYTILSGLEWNAISLYSVTMFQFLSFQNYEKGIKLARRFKLGGNIGHTIRNYGDPRTSCENIFFGAFIKLRLFSFTIYQSPKILNSGTFSFSVMGGFNHFRKLTSDIKTCFGQDGNELYANIVFKYSIFTFNILGVSYMTKEKKINTYGVSSIGISFYIKDLLKFKELVKKEVEAKRRNRKLQRGLLNKIT